MSIRGVADQLVYPVDKNKPEGWSIAYFLLPEASLQQEVYEGNHDEIEARDQKEQVLQHVNKQCERMMIKLANLA